jgi:hypothetical protein
MKKKSLFLPSSQIGNVYPFCRILFMSNVLQHNEMSLLVRLLRYTRTETIWQMENAKKKYVWAESFLFFYFFGNYNEMCGPQQLGNFLFNVIWWIWWERKSFSQFVNVIFQFEFFIQEDNIFKALMFQSIFMILNFTNHVDKNNSTLTFKIKLYLASTNKNKIQTLPH